MQTKIHQFSSKEAIRSFSLVVAIMFAKVAVLLVSFDLELSGMLVVELVSAIVKILVLDLLCLAFSIFKQYLVVRKIKPDFMF